MHIFAGYDAREAAGFGAFLNSLIATTSGYWLRPLCGAQADGTNAFTYARFRIPELMLWSGWALWLDGADMLVRSDLAALWALRDPRYAVQVVKHEYRTKHPRKYVGTAMEAANPDYPRKNWSSLILWNCAHGAHFAARRRMQTSDGAFLHRFGWLEDAQIGALPADWNWLADEYGENASAKLLHWTAGIPGFAAYRGAPHAAEWHAAAAAGALSGTPG